MNINGEQQQWALKTEKNICQERLANFDIQPVKYQDSFFSKLSEFKDVFPLLMINENAQPLGA